MDDMPWDHNEHGWWCPSCGHHMANPDDDAPSRGDCPECGFPDPAAMYEYHSL